MIVVDASALVAIHLGEPEAERFSAFIYQSGEALIAAPSAVEYAMVVIGRHGEDSREKTARLIADFGLGIADFTAELAALATDAFVRYGKGQHPARLNYGDCMAYALAKSLDAPLLFKGDDFVHTDIAAALPPVR